MNDTVRIENEKFLSTRDAGHLTGFSRDYLARLCKKGKLQGKLIGNSWYIQETSIRLFLAEQGRALKVVSLGEPPPVDMGTLAALPREKSVPPDSVKIARSRAALYAHNIDRNVRQNSRRSVLRAGAAGFVVLTLILVSLSSVTNVASRQSGEVAAAGTSGIFDSAGDFVSRKLCSFFHLCPVSIAYQAVADSASVTPHIAAQSVSPSSSIVSTTTSSKSQPISYVYNYPVIERVVETQKTLVQSGVSEEDLAARLQELNNKLVAQIYGITSAPSTLPAAGGYTNNIAVTQRIDRLSGVAISGGTISGAAISGGSITGVSLSAGDITGAIGIAQGGTGTSTAPSYGKLLVGNAAGGYDLAATSTLGIGGANTSVANTWTALQIFSANASSTNFSNFGTAYFGGTATSTFDSTGLLTLPSGFLSQASSTIGNGTQTGGLTISGGATTTGNAAFTATSGTTTIASGQGFTVGSSQLVVQQGSGNVGIGTTTPGSLLSVQGNGLFSGNLALANLTATGTVTTAGITNTGTFSQTGLASFSIASTTLLSVFNKAYFGGTATTTIDSAGNILAAGTLNVTGLSTFAGLISSASSTVLGDFTSTGTGTFASGAFTSTSATTTFGGGLAVGSNYLNILQNGRVGIGTAAPTVGFEVGVATKISGDLTVSGGSTLLISASGPVTQTGTGQVTFAGNVDATNGLDVTTANFTVGGSNFIVAPGTGNTTVAGTFGLTGAAAASSTLQVTGASRFYSSLWTDGALTAAGTGTGLSVTNNASIGGTFALTGAGTFSSTLAVSGLLTAATTTFTGDVALSGKKITGLATPSADQDAANKTYVDSVAQGLSLKDSVRAGTTVNITISGEQTIDGVSLVAGDRVLVKDQADQTKNGIYVVSSGAWARATDADANSEVTSGMFTFITDGTANASSGWVLTTTGAITLGTSLLSFTQFSGAGQIIAGTGITKSGNTINTIGTTDRITANADSIDIASTYVGQTSITTVGALTSGSLGSGFGNINIGASTITGGVATFSSIVGSAINGTGNLSISGSGTFSNGLTVTGGTLSAATTTFSGDVAFGGKKITGLADPTSAQEAATKAYVDAIAQGLTVKASVRAGTTANITLSGAQTIDGVAVVAGDRVLVKNQTTGSQNGIYVAAAGAWSRSTDADANSEVVSGMYTFISEGTSQANTGWSLITPNTITLDTTSLTFTQFSGSAETTAGNGLTKSGNTINTVGTADRITVSADSIDIASTYAGQSSILTVGTLTSGAIGSGFGAINIGSSALTAGAATFASAKSFGSLLVGGTATTTISGDSATSTFSGGLSLAAGNVNLATGGRFLINNVLTLSATTLGSNVLGSSLTSVGALDSGSITTGFGAINIGSDTLDAGNTTLTNATTTTLFSSIASSTSLYSTNGTISALTAGTLSLTALTAGSGTFSSTLGVTGLASFTQASTTRFSVFDKAYFGGTATSTFDSTGALTLTGALTYGGVTLSNAVTGTGNMVLSASPTLTGTLTAAAANFSGKIGIGTTTPWAKLSIAGAAGGTDALFSISSSTAAFATSTVFHIDSNGNVGIGTSTPAGKFSVTGSGTGTGILAKFFNSAFTAVVSVLDNGTAYFLGNVGIGTTTPTRKLSVTDTVASAQVAFAYDNTRYAELRVDSTGDFNMAASGGDFYLNNDNFWACTGGSITVAGCPSGTPTGFGNIIAENKLGIGTSTPASKLTIETQDTTTNFFQVASSTAQSLFVINANGNIGVGTSSPFAKFTIGAGGAITTAENSLTDGATVAINWLDGNQQKVTLGGNRTITFSNYIAGQILRLIVCQDATGSRTITWPAVVLWNGGTAPTLTTTANKCDLVSFVGTNATSSLVVFGAAALAF